MIDWETRYYEAGKPLPQDEVDAMTARLVEDTNRMEALGRPVKPHRSGGGELVHQVCNVPDGWKLVPITPTRAMVSAYYANTWNGGHAVYTAMLATAPDYESVACTKQEAP